ncbi:hypothetical protein BDV95DRAFT_484538 [Massariosphaeria phaeospora]|uniref:dihydroneopterin aldolase n=1 Tax=Massariosphaeria phaeospora TaxID=100035 RepID=A0A7C8IC60_9PLEO|nr:hypothetical protein BDV95DRAFT_484538 [Massariosphaeria phaeospora]
MQHLREAVWQGRLAIHDVIDQITVRNLEATVDAGVDVWGRKRKQRAFITVTLSLTKPFDSAAAADALDHSTVHYGQLSKAIQNHVEQQNSIVGWQSTKDLVRGISECASHIIKATRIRSMETDVCYLKGSMFGDGAGYKIGVLFQDDSNNLPESQFYRILYLRNVRIPCIIGVNPNERQQKQPVIINLAIECLQNHRSDDYAKLETVVVETLETLSTTVVQDLRAKFFNENDGVSYIKLRVEKPQAVPFADAPAIEIVRPVKP